MGCGYGRIDSSVVMPGVFSLSVKSKRLLRPLTGVVIAFAVAIQTLLIAVGGFSPPADAARNAPAFELCLHDTSGAPVPPADDPNHSACTHCIFCFAGAHHTVFGTSPELFQRVDVVTAVIPWHAAKSGSKQQPRYTIANPRGPPVVA